MATSYYNNPPRSRSSSNRDHSYTQHYIHTHKPASLLDRLISVLPSSLAPSMHALLNRQSYHSSNVSTQSSKLPRSLRQAQRGWKLGRILTLPHVLVLVWVLLLLWGERWVFRSAVEECGWGRWERWVSYSTLYLIFSGFAILEISMANRLLRLVA